MSAQALETPSRREKLYEWAGVDINRRLMSKHVATPLKSNNASQAMSLLPDWEGVHARLIRRGNITVLNKAFDRFIREVDEDQLPALTEASHKAWQTDCIADIFPRILPVRALIVHEVSSSCIALSLAMRGPSYPNFGDFLAMDLAERHIAENILPARQ